MLALQRAAIRACPLARRTNMKTLPSILLKPVACLLITIPAWAGPPLICKTFDIGSAKSLPWKAGPDWQGAEPAYNLANLPDETLSLLTPGTPMRVRMETLRRAGIYSAKDARLAGEITGRLMARALDAEASGTPDPLAWFDAGYFVETIRQATFVYRYSMLNPAERASWQLRGDTQRLDGYPWVRKAIRLGGVDMDYALSLIAEFRREDLRPGGAVTISKH
jgi:hypothetical protein